MPETRRMRPLLGTFVEVGTADAAPVASAAIDAAFACIATLQRLLAFQDPDSELSRLNRAPTDRWVPMSGTSLRVLRLARAMSRASAHCFNCTVGGRLVTLGVLPRHDTRARLETGEAEDIGLRPGAAQLRRPVLITLDGIAKGYAVDCATRALQRAGLASGWVNAGGDLRVFGDRALTIALRGAAHRSGTIELRNAALATSRTGSRPDPDFPALLVGEGARSCREPVLSVAAPRAWLADALTKVAANAPPPARGAAVAALGGQLVGAT